MEGQLPKIATVVVQVSAALAWLGKRGSAMSLPSPSLRKESRLEGSSAFSMHFR